jgi:hypothetical protein
MAPLASNSRNRVSSRASLDGLLQRRLPYSGPLGLGITVPAVFGLSIPIN